MKYKLVVFFLFVFVVFYLLFHFMPMFLLCLPICLFGVIQRGEGWKIVFPNAHKIALLAILLAAFSAHNMKLIVLVFAAFSLLPTI
ncbi:MAG: hypothetical protein LBG78_02865 [Azoarcus sp.]|jgi:hypothetical protein|nr:hypothetical protein [Azoarcus sp.]